MSIRSAPVLICDGCGTVIEKDFFIKISPQHQEIVQQDPSLSTDRDFCCEACLEWWQAQFPADGPWGPAWDEHDWWCTHVGPCAERARVRTAHEELPLLDTKVHFESPEHVL